MRTRLLHSLISAAGVLFLAATLLALHRVGSASRKVVDRPRPLRTALPRHTLVDTSKELLDLWIDSGARGRLVVHLSRFLHFVPVDATAAEESWDRFPIATFDLARFSKDRVTPRNLLWVAMEVGVARSVTHVLPPAELDARLASLDPAAPGLSVRGRAIRTHDHGSPRLVLDRLPRTREPVLLSIDASFLSSVPPDRLSQMLVESGLSSDLVALCLSTDNPDVADASRDLLARWSAHLRKREP